MAAGTLALAIAAVFATKANKKFTGLTTAYFDGGSAWVSYPSIFTNSQVGVRLQVKIITAGLKTKVTAQTLKTKLLGNDVYFN